MKPPIMRQVCDSQTNRPGRRSAPGFAAVHSGSECCCCPASSVGPRWSVAGSRCRHPRLGWVVSWAIRADWGPWTSARASSVGSDAPRSRMRLSLRREYETGWRPLRRPSYPLHSSLRGDSRSLACLGFACLRLPWGRRRDFLAPERISGQLVRRCLSVQG